MVSAVVIFLVLLWGGFFFRDIRRRRRARAHQAQLVQQLHQLHQQAHEFADRLRALPGYGDTWWAYDCSSCGAVWDIRTEENPGSMPCPLCRELAELRGSWAASEWGYGSRADDNGDIPDHAV